jgi:hypothetical protein
MLGAEAPSVMGLFNVMGSWGSVGRATATPNARCSGPSTSPVRLAMAVFNPRPVSSPYARFAAVMGLWIGVIPLLNAPVVQMFGIKFLSTLTGIAFLSHQVGSFLGAVGGGAIYNWLGSNDRARSRRGRRLDRRSCPTLDRPARRLAAENPQATLARALQ